MLGAFLVADALFFSSLNPYSSRSILLFAGFILLAATVYLCIQLIRRALAAVAGREVVPSRRLPLFLTLFVSILLALQSVGQLTVRDSVALVIVGVIVWFYSTYLRPQRRT